MGVPRLSVDGIAGLIRGYKIKSVGFFLSCINDSYLFDSLSFSVVLFGIDFENVTKVKDSYLL